METGMDRFMDTSCLFDPNSARMKGKAQCAL
jgi:hypothetical protein